LVIIHLTKEIADFEYVVSGHGLNNAFQVALDDTEAAAILIGLAHRSRLLVRHRESNA
jgi:hypothetical protein